MEKGFVFQVGKFFSNLSNESRYLFHQFNHIFHSFSKELLDQKDKCYKEHTSITKKLSCKYE